MGGSEASRVEQSANVRDLRAMPRQRAKGAAKFVIAAGLFDLPSQYVHTVGQIDKDTAPGFSRRRFRRVRPEGFHGTEERQSDRRTNAAQEMAAIEEPSLCCYVTHKTLSTG